MAIIVLTGGPCGGKSTTLQAIRDEMSDNPRVLCLGEVATSLLRQHRYDLTAERERIAFQEDIFERQMEAEEKLISPDRVLIVDRGILDGAVYWPGGVVQWSRYFGVSRNFCFSRYSTVIHFESLARGKNYELNDVRVEDRETAANLDQQTEKVWRGHRNRHIFLASQSVSAKIDMLKAHIHFALRKITGPVHGDLPAPFARKMIRLGLLPAPA